PHMKAKLVTTRLATLVGIGGLLAIPLRATAQTSNENWTPPTHVDSPDQQFSVEITDNPNSGGKFEIERLLVIVRDHSKAIASYPTYGYLLDVYWDDTGKYVAVNNRRANAGDYVWVFSLPDGKCLKQADSQQFSFLSKRAREAFKRIDGRA